MELDEFSENKKKEIERILGLYGKAIEKGDLITATQILHCAKVVIAAQPVKNDGKTFLVKPNIKEANNHKHTDN